MAGIFWERNAPALSDQKIAEIEKISVGAPSLTHLRGKAAIVSSRDAALRLKFGSCQRMNPPKVFESRCCAVGERGEHSRLDCERRWRGNLIGKRTPLCG